MLELWWRCITSFIPTSPTNWRRERSKETTTTTTTTFSVGEEKKGCTKNLRSRIKDTIWQIIPLSTLTNYHQKNKEKRQKKKTFPFFPRDILTHFLLSLLFCFLQPELSSLLRVICLFVIFGCACLCARSRVFRWRTRKWTDETKDLVKERWKTVSGDHLSRNSLTPFTIIVNLRFLSGEKKSHATYTFIQLFTLITWVLNCLLSRIVYLCYVLFIYSSLFFHC